jgi:hypothetical protein
MTLRYEYEKITEKFRDGISFRSLVIILTILSLSFSIGWILRVNESNDNAYLNVRVGNFYGVKFDDIINQGLNNSPKNYTYILTSVYIQCLQIEMLKYEEIKDEYFAYSSKYINQYVITIMRTTSITYGKNIENTINKIPVPCITLIYVMILNICDQNYNLIDSKTLLLFNSMKISDMFGVKVYGEILNINIIGFIYQIDNENIDITTIILSFNDDIKYMGAK